MSGIYFRRHDHEVGCFYRLNFQKFQKKSENLWNTLAFAASLYMWFDGID